MIWIHVCKFHKIQDCGPLNTGYVFMFFLWRICTKKYFPSGWLVTGIFTQRIMKKPFIFHRELGFFQTFAPWTNTIIQSWHLSLTNSGGRTPFLCLSALRAAWQTPWHDSSCSSSSSHYYYCCWHNNLKDNTQQNTIGLVSQFRHVDIPKSVWNKKIFR